MKEGSPPEDLLWGQGIAPNSKYVNQNALMLSRWPPEDWAILTRDAVTNGAQIMNNSWTDMNGENIGYTANERRFDQLSRDPTDSSSGKSLVIVFSAGNSGPKNNTITSPHEPKNPIIVGNSWTYRPSNYYDIRGIAEGSSRAPARDGRILPHIVAPGTYVPSAWLKTGNSSQWIDFVPNTQNKYMYGTGTSMAAPQVSGCCALLIEWWRKRTSGKTPSLALLKSLLVNSAIDIAGGPSNRLDENGRSIPISHIPNNDQGWGLVNLKRIVQVIPGSNKKSKIFSDQSIYFYYGQRTFSTSYSSR